MTRCTLLSLALVLSFTILQLGTSIALEAGTDDGSEQWGYVEVRPKAHLFWWLYRSRFRVEDVTKPWPTILWLQGGPGGSGVGFGNFMEIGPLDGNLAPRNYTWLRKADLLFVDNPVGTGFSYVENKSLVVKTDVEAATDLTTLLKELCNRDQILQKSPLYIFAESYGGKFAATLGVSVLHAIEVGELKLQLGGVALGDSWISPEDFVLSWGPLLNDMSRISNYGLKESNRLALEIQQQIAEGMYEEATSTWRRLEDVVLENSNHVNFYNFLLDVQTNALETTTTEGLKILASGRYSTYLSSSRTFTGNVSAKRSVDLDELMNGPIRKKLKIIPEDLKWGEQGYLVFQAMVGDFMKPRIQQVDQLLSKGINVTVYNGQLDLICATKGTEAWVKKLKWDGLEEFLSQNRTALYCGDHKTTTRGFLSSYKNFSFYWILGAGHLVPADQPCISLQMVGSITGSPYDDLCAGRGQIKC